MNIFAVLVFKILMHNFFLEPRLEFVRDLDYDKEKGEKASKALFEENWSGLYCAYLEKIDMSKDGDFIKNLNSFKKSIADKMAKDFPRNESVERLFVQHALSLANWT